MERKHDDGPAGVAWGDTDLFQEKLHLPSPASNQVTKCQLLKGNKCIVGFKKIVFILTLLCDFGFVSCAMRIIR
ncbi:hypothetical protein Plhal710r2_c009g0042771 [Plasmopara halstedii]